MSRVGTSLSRDYEEKLQRFLADGEEAILQEAYEMGRNAMARGLGVMDIAKIHLTAWSRILASPPRRQKRVKALGGAETFLLETLSPFEATQRGFREANAQLRQLIETLQERNASLARSEMRLAEAQQLAHLGSWDWTIATNVVNWSDELRRIYGLKTSRFKTDYKGFLRRVHSEDREHVQAIISAALNDGRPFAFQHRLVRPDGSVRILYAQGRVGMDAQGRPLRLFGTAQDVTELKKAEEAVQVSEARLQAILDHSPAIIYLKDTRGRYLLVNRQFERRFRLGRHRVMGVTDRKIFSAAQAKAFRATDREVLEAGIPLVFEETASYPDGLHASIVSKFPLRDGDGRIYALCGIATDITQRKQAEEALRQSEEHYRQLFNEAQQMQEGLRSLSNQLLNVQEEERKRISRELHDEVGQALTAVNVSLTMLKREAIASNPSLEPRLADAQNLLEQTMASVHRFARELRPAMLDDLGLLPALRSYLDAFTQRTGIPVDFTAGEGAEGLDSDQKTVVYRVAQEGLTNVAKHAHATRVEVGIEVLAHGIRMTIRDNGQAFRQDPAIVLRGKKRLGLLGMQERVRQVNGKFAVESEPGKGTTLRVEVPFPQRPAALESLTQLVNHSNPRKNHVEHKRAVG